MQGVRKINTNLQVNRGKITGQEARRQFGKNEAVGTTYEAIWPLGGMFNFPTTAQPIRVAAGGDAADDVAGLGARTISIDFLDENWNEVTEVLSTAGIVASASTTANCIRLNRVRVETSGTYHASNTGAITIEQETSGLVMSYLAAGTGVSEQALYSVPAGKTIYVTKISASVGAANSATIKLLQVHNADDTTPPFTSIVHEEWAMEDYAGDVVFGLDTYIQATGKQDIWFEAVRVTGGGSALVSVDFDFRLLNGLDTVKN
jgi:hypothetical protein